MKRKYNNQTSDPKHTFLSPIAYYTKTALKAWNTLFHLSLSVQSLLIYKKQKTTRRKPCPDERLSQFLGPKLVFLVLVFLSSKCSHFSLDNLLNVNYSTKSSSSFKDQVGNKAVKNLKQNNECPGSLNRRTRDEQQVKSISGWESK